MTYQVVVSKRFNQAAIRVTVEHDGLAVAVDMADFLREMADVAIPLLAADATRHAGNPSLLLTNAQLSSRIVSSLVADEVLTSLAMAADAAVAAMKKAAIVAK